jgi:hypothetical protein
MPGVEILDTLKSVLGAFEAHLRTEYIVYRHKRGGGVQEVRVEVLDAGPSMGPVRFHVSAKSDDGRTATGNPAESLEIALATVHWGDLDK